MTQHAGVRGKRFDAFMRALLCVNLPHAPFYTRTTHCHLRRGNCQQTHLERTNQNNGFKMTALELLIIGFDYVLLNVIISIIN